MFLQVNPGKVILALCSDPSLLEVVRGAVRLLAGQHGFGEAETLNLQHAVEQACRIIFREHYAGQRDQILKLCLQTFADRMEIVLEDSGTPAQLDAASPDAFLVARGVDRVMQEQPPEGGNRLTLVKYRSGR